MVAAGLSLLKTLNILAEQTENKKLQTALVAVARDVEVGIRALGRPRQASAGVPAAHGEHGARG